ncbi:hypothetical protein NKH18_06890 [Streptomyces sp. M10(2022)]
MVRAVVLAAGQGGAAGRDGRGVRDGAGGVGRGGADLDALLSSVAGVAVGSEAPLPVPEPRACRASQRARCCSPWTVTRHPWGGGGRRRAREEGGAQEGTYALRAEEASWAGTSA